EEEEEEFNDELCDGKTHANNGRDRYRISELSSLNRDDCAPRYSDSGQFDAFRKGKKSSMKQDTISLCDTLSSTDGNSSHPGATQWKMEADPHNDTLSHERHPTMSPSPINNKHRRIEGNETHSQISTIDTSNRSEGFGTHVYQYFKDSSNKAITILVVFTSVVVMICFTTIVIDDFKEKQRNGNGIGLWSKNNDALESEESRHQSSLPDEEFADSSPTLSPTVEVTFRNIFESNYSRGTDSPSPTILKLVPTSYPSPSPIDLAEEFLALDIPPLPSSQPVSAPWSQRPSRSPTILPTPHLSKEPTLRPSPQPSKIHPTVMPTGNPSIRPSPFPFASPTFPPSPTNIPSTSEPTGPPTKFPSQPRTTGVPTLTMTFVTSDPTNYLPIPVVPIQFGECPIHYSPMGSYIVGSYVSQPNLGAPSSNVYRCEGRKCASRDHIPPDPNNSIVSGWILVGSCTTPKTPPNFSTLAPTISPHVLHPDMLS
ncbi:hypothetical protein ACHAXH_002991, partial [Discostella pseudostelligera]